MVRPNWKNQGLHDFLMPVIQEVLRRARYKFPGRQKIIVWKKWGFMNVNKEDYLKLKAEKRVIQCVIFIIFLGLV